MPTVLLHENLVKEYKKLIKRVSFQTFTLCPSLEGAGRGEEIRNFPNSLSYLKRGIYLSIYLLSMQYLNTTRKY